MVEIDITALHHPDLRIKFNQQQRIYQTVNYIFIEGETVIAKIPKIDVENLIKALQKAVELGWTE